MIRVLSNKQNIRGLSNIFCSSSVQGPKNIIDESTTGTSYYDDFLDPSQENYLRSRKNLVGHIEYMTPLEYYQNCASKVFNTSVDSLKHQRSSDKSSINYLTDAMNHGRKFQLPYVNYADKGQEGLHRMMVIADKYGWTEYSFPVLVVEFADEERHRNEEAYKCLRKSVDEALEFAYSEDTWKEEIKDQIQWELDKLCEYRDKKYICDILERSDDSIDVVIDGCNRSEVYENIQTSDIRFRDDSDNYFEITEEDLEDLDLDLDFDDFDNLLKNLNK